MSIDKNLGNLMKEAQKMQQRMQEAQDDLLKLEVKGEAGGVEIHMRGDHYATKIVIPESVCEDNELTEDLVKAAINSAVEKIEKESKKKIGKLTDGLNIPTDIGNE